MIDPNTFLAGTEIRVSKTLYAEVIEEGWRLEKKETALLMWRLIADKYLSNQRDWAYVPDKQFSKITTNRNTKCRAKEYLLNKGFIELLLWGKSNKYAGKPRRIFSNGNAAANGECYQFKANYVDDELVTVPLRTKTALSIRTKTTQNEPLSQYYEEVQKGLTLNWDLVQHFIHNNWVKLDSIDASLVRNQTTRLHYKIGYARRGKKINRLSSTWTATPRIARPLFTLEDQEMVAFDLKVAQPSLLASKLNDDVLLQACYENRLYSEVQEITNEPIRDDAKVWWNTWCLGMNKTSKKKWQKKAVRDYVRENYPITFRHVWDAKETDHLPFSREMMNYEADLFIDGILKEIEQKDLAALSVHDCIYCKRTDEETIEEIMQKHISEKIPSGKFKLDKEEVKYKEREGVLCL